MIRIKWQESRRKKLCPVILIEPISLDGSVINKVTGFNAKYIKDNEIGPGTILTVVKQG